MRFFALFLFASLFLFCQNKSEDTQPTPAPPTPAVDEKIDILALGDSYTKGESVPWEENFPNQLVDSLRANAFEVSGLHVVAQTGWRTDNLQNALANQSATLDDSIFSLVTLCIGVNNQYQNASFETYKKEFEALVKYAIARAGDQKSRVVVVSIPDWAYTPYGQGNAAVSQKIDQYNAANKSISDAYGVHYVNVTEVSRRGLAEPNLVAYDGLHPSAKQYTEWVRLLLPVVKTALKS